MQILHIGSGCPQMVRNNAKCYAKMQKNLEKSEKRLPPWIPCKTCKSMGTICTTLLNNNGQYEKNMKREQWLPTVACQQLLPNGCHVMVAMQWLP